MTESRKMQRRGFTLVELVAVICILSILATLALVVYSRVAIDRYDAEATATLNALGEQSLILMSDWGVGTQGITAGCIDLSVAGAGLDGGAVAGVSTAGAALGYKIDGPQHWFYQACFGTDNGTEIYLVSAHRITPSGNQRVLISGSGFSAPVVAYTGETGFGTVAFETPSTKAITAWNRDKSTSMSPSGD